MYLFHMILHQNLYTLFVISTVVNNFNCFTVILDLKALYLLLVKKDDQSFQLEKRGIEVECCFICKALRVCFDLNC